MASSEVSRVVLHCQYDGSVVIRLLISAQLDESEMQVRCRAEWSSTRFHRVVPPLPTGKPEADA